MAGYNRVIMVGNLTRDPEYKQLTSGQAVCRLGLASNRQFKNRQTGDMIQEVCYVDVDVWGAQAESCRQYLQKGRPVLVEGRLKLSTWEDSEGQNRNKHSIVADRIVFLSSGAAEVGESVGGMQPSQPSQQNGAVKEAFDQLEELKRKEAKAEAPAQPKKGDEGATGFKDEPPFQDDLPF